MVITFIQDSARNDKVTINTSNTLVSEARNEQNLRKTLILRNTSAGAQVITISLGYQQAEAENGIVLKPGESYYENTETGYMMFQGTINAISDIADGKLSVMER